MSGEGDDNLKLTDLYNYAEQHDIDVDCFPMERAAALSMPLGDGRYGIALDPWKLDCVPEELCCLAHEIGHCETNAFYNRYSPFDVRKKHENTADKWAIRHILPRERLARAIADGYTTAWELAEHLGVTEPFVRKAICFYQNGNFADV